MSSLKTMIDLKPCKSLVRQKWQSPHCKTKAVKKSLPFLESFRGAYAHRVKHVTIHTADGESWFAIKVWCGASFCNGSSTGKGQTYFTEEPTNNRPICATCEGRFIGAGVAGDREINGRKVMYSPMDRGAL